MSSERPQERAASGGAPEPEARAEGRPREDERERARRVHERERQELVERFRDLSPDDFDEA